MPPRTHTPPAVPARGVDSTECDTDTVLSRYTGVTKRVHRIPGGEREPAGCPEHAAARGADSRIPNKGAAQP